MTQKIRTIIVDDDQIAREDLQALLQKDPGIAVAGMCANGAEALGAIDRNDIDLLLLDIQMPGMNGLQLLKTLPPEKIPVTVLVTAHDEYALQAFKAHAVDFLLKPFTEAEFWEVLTHAKEAVALRLLNRSKSTLLALLGDLPRNSVAGNANHPRNARGANSRSGLWLQRIPVNLLGKIHFVDTDQVQWVEAADNYVRLHTETEVHVVRDTITHFESKLDPARFGRVHRSAIVNVDYIAELRPYFMGEYVVILHDGTRLRVSRNRREKFRKLMNLR
jgi:two-component system LytT family response regulator